MSFWKKILLSRWQKKKGVREHGDASSESSRKADESSESSLLKADMPIQQAKTVVRRAASGKTAGILLASVVTEKSASAGALGVYAFTVARDSTKPEIKRAVESRFNVSVERVRVIVMPGKERRRGKQIGWRPGFKKAMVTVKEGQTIELQ